MSDTKTGLLAAVLEVQHEAPTLKKDATNPHFKSKYAPLDTIVETIQPILFKHGLVWMTLPGTDAHGSPSLTYRLAHASSGEVLEGEMPLMLSKQDAQGQGSAITYARRYALCAVLNLVADDDDDGNEAAAVPRAYGKAPARAASDAQRGRLKRDIRASGFGEKEVDVLFKGVGFVRGEGEKVNDAIGRLTGVQASAMIDEIAKGLVKTGETDVPAATEEFVHDPGEGTEPLPFDSSVPS